MFGFAWSEWMLVGVVALIAIGPKDMPVAIRTMARLIRRARGMAHEFQGHVDEMVRGTEFDEIKESLGDLRGMGLSRFAGRALDGDGALRQSLRDPFAPPSPPADSPAAAPERPPAETDLRFRRAVPVPAKARPGVRR